LWWGGNRFCRAVLAASGAHAAPDTAGASPADEARALAAGRAIGVLERSLVLVGIVTARWEVVAGVVALKTVARYKELDQQFNAEYFLIGSLASLLWAALVTLALLVYDARLGFELAEALRGLLGRPPARTW
jgi:hypothetical protein